MIVKLFKYGSKKVKFSFCTAEFNLMKEKLYKPKQRLQFKNSLTKIYDANSKVPVRSLAFFIFGLHVPVLYYTGRKIQNFKDRHWFTLIFFSLIFVGSLYSLKSNYSTLNTIINKIYLLEDGKNIVYKTQGSLFTRKCIITNIQRPINPNIPQELSNFGIPVTIDEQVYILCREAEILHKDVFQQIMNGNYIDTQLEE